MADINIKAGDLNQRITFQQPTINKDAGGAQTAAYANIGSNPTVWSKWEYDHGQELVSSEAEKSEQRATVTIRYRSDVSEKWQVLNGSAVWKIISVDQVRERNRWTVLRVERVKGTV